MAETIGGIPVAGPTDAGGSLVTEAGHVQFGRVLFGAGSAAGWLNLTGWRDLPDTQVSDSLRPQAHGAYPGDVFGDSLVVTVDFLLRGRPDAKAADEVNGAADVQSCEVG